MPRLDDLPSYRPFVAAVTQRITDCLPLVDQGYVAFNFYLENPN
jgi:hypothetical protein